MAKTSKPATPIASHKHKDRRTNIPTEELRGFVADDERTPKNMLYPRDPSLDPQLVWKGKDEQDAADLSVPVVPIYIQEKIHPHSIIEDIRRQGAAMDGDDDEQMDFFGDFNGLDDFEKKLEFYQHEQHWSNRMILGDSLLVMNSLAEKEGLKGKVQSIYLDPPYGIKFGSNWQVSTRKRDVKDGKVEDATRQPEQVRAFRDTWQLGIHSYLAYLRDRLVVARELLTETGSVFVQIGDENVHLVRSVMDEVFGAENFCSQICVKKTAAQTDEVLSSVADYLLWFAKDRNHAKLRNLFQPKIFGDRYAEQYRWIQLPDGTRRRLSVDEQPQEMWRNFRPDNLTSSHEYSKGKEQYLFEGTVYDPNARYWSTSPEGIRRLDRCSRLVGTGRTLSYLRYLDDFSSVPLLNMWTDTGTGGYGDDRYYVVQTTMKVIQRCLLMTTDPGDLVLDPTCGSGTTAYVAEQWGRRWITIDTSRVALALARTRLMAGKFPFYLLADSKEGVQKESELTGKIPPDYETDGDIKKGFVYKRVPHVTLKAIANNEEIDVIHEKWQPKQDAARMELSKALKKSWEDWEVPREIEDGWSESVKAIHAKFWKLRQDRQREIDASIARRADQETLFDQPFEDNKRVRVTGPFTVESLSPHRVLAPDDDLDGVATTEEIHRHQDFSTMILENLKKAGVKGTDKSMRIAFDTLEPHAGEGWINATGTYSDADGTYKRVAVTIGPEYGTVGPAQVKDAAKEAVKGIGYDVLVVCGFAFDPHVAEEVKRYGKLTVLQTRMNPDLAMGEDLLKKTGAGNLFTVFGEADVTITKTDAGEIVVELTGLDVFDPSTGEIRSKSTDDIACWFIDTDYNGESFFVRHAYFTGAQEPFEKLKRALRAEINEDVWSSLYKTTSRPFPRPETGKIAVKVINHYGDEVLNVYPV